MTKTASSQNSAVVSGTVPPSGAVNSRDGKTWTIIISTPDGQSCLVAAGEGWRAVPKAAGSMDPKA